jgi:hypothetical protein
MIGTVRVIGLSFVYTSSNGAKMKDISADKGEDKFAKGQSRRDLRVSKANEK